MLGPWHPHDDYRISAKIGESRNKWFLEMTESWVQNYSKQKEINSSQLPILEPVLKPSLPSYTTQFTPILPATPLVRDYSLHFHSGVWFIESVFNGIKCFLGALQQFLSVVGKCFYVLDRIHLSCNIIAFHNNFYQGRNVLRRNRLRISTKRQLH